MPNASGGYKPLADYGAIGNLRTVALVGIDGSIDWCCFPHLDSPSVFAAILDLRRGGRFRVAPVGVEQSKQRYIDGTNVLETIFRAPGGRLTVTDLMPVGGNLDGRIDSTARSEILRVLTCEGGPLEVEVEWAPRFDYGRASTRIDVAEGGFIARSSEGDGRLVLSGLPHGGEIVDDGVGPAVHAQVQLADGDRLSLTTRWGVEDARGDRESVLRALQETTDAWQAWVYKEETPCAREWAGPWHAQVIRSELALKLLAHADTGAVAAAATTSLPETIGGVRNWDYRYAWIRDAALVVQALSALGHRAEANEFLHWAERVSEAHMVAEHGLQIMYGLHGEADLSERALDHLEGYRGSRPLRVGNGAVTQRQSDIYGELLTSAYELVRQEVPLEPHIWSFLSAVTDRACAVWREEDDGVWEQRNGPRHYVYSKMMVWAALDRAIHLTERHELRGDVAQWRRSRDEVRQVILAQGYDPDLGAFVQSFDRRDPDASNLLIPHQEFLPFDDPRVQGTIDATLKHLTEHGLVYRYRNDDGLPGEEGAFGLCTFWLVDALALSGRLEEAHEIYDGIARRANHVGLYSEQIDPGSGEFLGNLPQAFTHLGFINSTLYLAYAEGRGISGPPLIGTREHRQALGHPGSA